VAVFWWALFGGVVCSLVAAGVLGWLCLAVGPAVFMVGPILRRVGERWPGIPVAAADLIDGLRFRLEGAGCPRPVCFSTPATSQVSVPARSGSSRAGSSVSHAANGNPTTRRGRP